MPSHEDAADSGADLDLGGTVRASRDRLGWSREALAYRSGLSWSAITQIESGRRANARPGTLLALAEALDVSVDYLLGASPTPLLHHEALVYASEDEFVAGSLPIVEQAIDRSEPVVVVTKSSNIHGLRGALGKRVASRVDFRDSSEAMSTPTHALETFYEVVQTNSLKGRTWSSAISEIMWPEENGVVLWARFEALFNLVFAASPISVTCAYDERSCPGEIIDIARKTHPYLRAGEKISRSHAYVDPAVFVLST